MEISEFKSIEEIQSLKKFFLYKNLNINFFQTFEFIEKYLTLNKNDFTIYLIKKENEFVILPLNLIKFKFIKLQGLIGSPHISEENNLIHNVSNYQDFETMLNTCFKEKKIKFFFNNIPKGFFKLYLDKNFYKLDYYSANVINLKNINKSFKKEKKYFDYIYRKFEKDHKLNLNNLIRKDIDASSIKEKDIKQFIKVNKIDDENYNKTIINYWLYFVKNNLAKINVLKIGNQILSIVIYVIFNKKIYYVIPCYNKIYKKYSFGRMHLYELLNEFINKDFEFFYLGPGSEKYKKALINHDETFFCYSNSKIIKIYFGLKNAIFKKLN